jgi:hypothetical protein
LADKLRDRRTNRPADATTKSLRRYRCNGLFGSVPLVSCPHQRPAAGPLVFNGLFGSALGNSVWAVHLRRREEVSLAPLADVAGADSNPVFGTRMAATDSSLKGDKVTANEAGPTSPDGGMGNGIRLYIRIATTGVNRGVTNDSAVRVPTTHEIFGGRAKRRGVFPFVRTRGARTETQDP